ncbi:MAG: sugar phosphate isomerase/epimerase [bacterium]
MAKLACDTYSLNDFFNAKKLTLQEAMVVIKDLGINYVGLNDFVIRDWGKPHLDEINQYVKDVGLTTVAVISGGNMASVDPIAREAQIEENIKQIEAAAYLGVSVIRFLLGTTGDKELDGTSGVVWCIEAINKMLPTAKRLNIKLGIENHGDLASNADRILDIIKATDPQWVGVLLDFGNWKADERIESCLKLAPYTIYAHAKTWAFNGDGEESRLDYAQLLGILKGVGYNGVISIEFEGHGDAALGVKKSADLIRKHWPGIE